MENGTELLVLTNEKGTISVSSQAIVENKIISKINSLLQLNHRSKALIEFDQLTKICNDATFSENCIKWLQFCCKLVSGNITEEIAGLKLFSKILVLSAEFPELGRQVANSVTSRFLELFSKHFSCHKEGWNALETLLLKYHGSFAAHKELLENLLKNAISETEAISTDNAKCFALFPLAGGGGAKNTQYKSNWREQFDKLLSTCHKLLNVVFTNGNELHVYEDSNGFNLIIPEDNLKNVVQVFSNCCLVLQYMLLGPFPVAKIIPVDAVLKLITRCLSISEITLKNKKCLITEELYVLLPTIHYDMVQTLSALVVCSKKTLLPVSSTISKILEQALQNASICKKLAIAVYSCVSNWLVSADGSASIHKYKKSLVPFILNDIQQKRGTVILRGKDKSKAPVRDKLDQFEWDEKICYSALKTLENLINTMGYKLEVHQHKMLQAVLLGIAFDLDRGSGVLKGMYRSSIRCRVVLYSVIIQLCLEPNPNWPPPTQYAIKVLNGGLNDSSPSVAKTCLIGATMLQRIIYPEFSIGCFPLNYQNYARETEKHLNGTSAMEVDIISSSYVPDTDVTIKTPTKLVTKTCSPWESFSFKTNILEIDILSKTSDLENVDVSKNIGNNLASAELSTNKIQLLTEIDKFSPIKTKQASKEDASVSLETTQMEIKSIEVAGRQKRSGSISSQSSIGDAKLIGELDSPMALRSGTLLASPSSNEHQRLSSVSPINTSDSSLKKNNVSSVDENVRPSSSNNVSSSTADVSSHMSLRSGTLLGSQPASERTRRSSISSQSSISCSQRKAVPSPVFEEEEMITFDDTVRDDYF